MMKNNPIEIRFALEDDMKCLIDWLQQPGVLQWFPLADLREIEDAARIWIGNSKHNAVLTALWEGAPCGMATLYIQPFKKLAHQSLLAIIVDEKFRGRGVGTVLLRELEKIAKERFQIELLHLEVYEGNPAIHLYQRLGFVQYGYQRRFIKDNGQYIGKIMMQKVL
ncbi:MAG: acetyltransferase [Parachlamydiales bacterium]|nr:acetyltransferase [Parachlamydiales bacterium]